MIFTITKFNKGHAGIILFVGCVQWLMMIIILESFQPNYNSAIHYVSSLGVGTTAIIYNASISLFGLSMVICSVIFYKSLGRKIFPLFFLITGLFVIGVGLFPENIRPIHGYVTAFAFLFAVFLPIISFKALNPPFSYLSIIIGLVSLVVLIAFFPYLGLPAESTILFLGLAKGTMERIIIYPLMFWMLSLSISLTNKA
ncbi:MAG: DUF998 domain-containing protein [Candidatus Lokiarchaeota archaeon]|nr:DUF998 domain-containing protein [Candidatus Lokiarchaeota archaeon]